MQESNVDTPTALLHHMEHAACDLVLRRYAVGAPAECAPSSKPRDSGAPGGGDVCAQTATSRDHDTPLLTSVLLPPIVQSVTQCPLRRFPARLGDTTDSRNARVPRHVWCVLHLPAARACPPRASSTPRAYVCPQLVYIPSAMDDEPGGIFRNLTVEVCDEKVCRRLLGDAHWNAALYERYCGGQQTGTVMRMVGQGLALVKFTHTDGEVSMLTFPLGALVRADPRPPQPGLFSSEALRPGVPCCVCGMPTNNGEHRRSGWKCRACVGHSSRWGFRAKRAAAKRNRHAGEANTRREGA